MGGCVKICPPQSQVDVRLGCRSPCAGRSQTQPRSVTSQEDGVTAAPGEKIRLRVCLSPVRFEAQRQRGVIDVRRSTWSRSGGV
jgi:hypothetical protein